MQLRVLDALSKNKRSERSERLCLELVDAGSENGVDVNGDRPSVDVDGHRTPVVS